MVKAREALLGARQDENHTGLEPEGETDDPPGQLSSEVDDGYDTSGANADGPSATAASLMDLLDQLEDQLDALPGDEAWQLVSELASRWSAAPFEPKGATFNDLCKLAADNARLSDALAVAAPRIEALERNLDAVAKRLDAVAAEPAAPRAAAGRIRAVSKVDDAGDDPDRGLSLSAEDFRKYLDSLPEDERGRLQLRAALSQPIRIDPR